MNILILGRGKTGALVAEVARQRKHEVAVTGAEENAQSEALAPEKLQPVDVVVDFTTPDAVLRNIEACVKSKTNMVVGTTGWYSELPTVRRMVKSSGIGFLYANNFSIGVNIFFDSVRSAAASRSVITHQSGSMM